MFHVMLALGSLARFHVARIASVPAIPQGLGHTQPSSARKIILAGSPHVLSLSCCAAFVSFAHPSARIASTPTVVRFKSIVGTSTTGYH